MTIFSNYKRICENIRMITEQEVKIIGVSKFQSIEKMQDAYKAGLYAFGENRVQEGEQKRNYLPEGAEWHLIGHLQKNKVRKAVKIFEWIHSVDTTELANLLSVEAGLQNKKPKILLQVNIAKEPQKFGITQEEAMEAAIYIKKLPNLELSGMMVIAPLISDAEEIRKIFSEGRKLFGKIQEQVGSNFEVLSMGMSNDYQIAIEEGANMVRIGRALFEEFE